MKMRIYVKNVAQVLFLFGGGGVGWGGGKRGINCNEVSIDKT